ncbi:BrnA antitoxin family protein [Halomonas citrativorans]|uniref:BrnA antitoxin family protein n=1 Tax=Halomonas TaxID=2745 RepID=UPI001868D603|nr:BrnA antitoxin family protein [Halomonas citrativorans]
MNAKENDTKATWIDPDDAPELTESWFEAAHQYDGDTLVKRGRGRPPIPESERKVPVKIRYDQDVIEAFRQTGKGWQTRVNQALRQYLKEHNVNDLS